MHGTLSYSYDPRGAKAGAGPLECSVLPPSLSPAEFPFVSERILIGLLCDFFIFVGLFLTSSSNLRSNSRCFFRRSSFVCTPSAIDPCPDTAR